MQSLKLSVLEKFILFLVFIIVLIGYILFYTNTPLFEKYVEEDGVVEWLTVFGLFPGAIVCFSRFATLLKKRSWWFLFVTLMLGLLLFFAAGEEISWGQRILGLKSPEFFAKNNAQHETNLHNLIVDGVKLNKLIFSFMLTIALGIFLLVLPWLYKKNKAISSLVDKSGVVVPRLYQIISFLVLFLSTSLLHHPKNAELLECGTGLLLFLIILYPENKSLFKNEKPGGAS